MRFTQKIKYNLKRALPLLTIAGAGLMASCDKDDEPSVPSREVEFTYNFEGPLIQEDLVRKAAADPSVSTIYIRPIGEGWERCKSHNIQFHRHNYLQPILNISPKIRGRGDFRFKRGEASKVPEDSLWYVQQGWTINKSFQKQK